MLNKLFKTKSKHQIKLDMIRFFISGFFALFLSIIANMLILKETLDTRLYLPPFILCWYCTHPKLMPKVNVFTKYFEFFGETRRNSNIKFVLLEIKFCVTCSQFNFYQNFLKFQNNMTIILDSGLHIIKKNKPKKRLCN